MKEAIGKKSVKLKAGFFENISKTDRLLARLTKEKKEKNQ